MRLRNLTRGGLNGRPAVLLDPRHSQIRAPELARLRSVATELEVLRIVSDRLTTVGTPFMLTGSFALAYYATPRMTRDLDIVVALAEQDVDRLVRA